MQSPPPQVVAAKESGPDSPEQPKTQAQDICLVFPEQHAQLNGGPRDPSQADRAFRRGFDKARAGDHLGALKWFDRAIDADPYHGLAHLSAAESHLYTDNDQTRMRRHLSAAVILLPSNPRAHLRLANHASEVGDRAVALTHLRCALQLKPTYAEARYTLAQLLLAMGRNAEAEVELQTVVREGHQPTRSLVLLSQAQAALGRLDQAAQSMEAAAQQAARSAGLYRQAARLYEAADSPLSARRMRRKADRLDPPPKKRRMRPLKKRRRRKRK